MWCGIRMCMCMCVCEYVCVRVRVCENVRVTVVFIARGWNAKCLICDSKCVMVLTSLCLAAISLHAHAHKL